MVKRRAATYNWVAALALWLVAFPPECRAQNDDPPPESIVPQLSGQPVPSQIMDLAKEDDGLNKDVYGLVSREGKLFVRVSVLEVANSLLQGQVKLLEDERQSHDAEDKSKLILSLLNSLGLGGTVVWQVRKGKALLLRRRKYGQEAE